MDLRHLRYFVAVAEEGSMTRAAERLGIQQPPLGQQIRLLEDDLQVQLFERRPRQITLSVAGAFFLEEARAVLRRVEDAVRDVRRFDAGESGHLNVGFTSSASLHPLAPKILRRFNETYPLAEVFVRESETYELILALQDGSIDAALFHIPTDRYPELASKSLAEEDMVVAVPVGHALTRLGRDVMLDDLLDQIFVVYRRKEGPGIFDTIVPTFAAVGATIRVGSEVTRLLAAINLVAAGRGISIVPATMNMVHPESVAYLPLARGTMPRLPLYLAHSRSFGLEIVRNFVATTLALTQ